MGKVVHRKISSRQCAVCGLGPVSSRQRSHSMRQTHRTVWKNLQQTPMGLLCAKCLRSAKNLQAA